MINIEVVYCAPEPYRINLQIPGNSTVQTVLNRPEVQRLPINIDDLEVAVWGKKVAPHVLVQENYRIELLRPLKISPMAARKIRADKKIKKTSSS